MSDATEVTAARCPTCGTATGHGERFCEGCGTPLGPQLVQQVVGQVAGQVAEQAVEQAVEHVIVVPLDLDGPGGRCPACPGPVAADGYCEQCGTPAVRPRDHFVDQPAAWVAAVCDRGRRHARNEDAVALAAGAEPGSFAALVVCDGVSSAPDSDVASLAAARAARDVLVALADDPADDPADDSGRPWDRAAWLIRAAQAAGEAAAGAATAAPGVNPPSCTFVAAVVGGPAPSATVAWIGDSRAYWLPDAGQPLQLSTDDSWAAEAMAHGLSREEAERLPQAHAITRWLGADAPPGPPRTAEVDVSAAGWLLVCSDGLWNYCSAPEDLAALVGQLRAQVGDEPVPLAEALTGWANAQGGQDNITVALARCGTS